MTRASQALVSLVVVALVGAAAFGAAEAPSNFRAGLLPSGKVRLGWEIGETVTNVVLQTWTLGTVGGITETASDDILWRETFQNAPATNSTIQVNTAAKLSLYTDRGAEVWDSSRFSRVMLSPVASSIQLGAAKKAVGSMATFFLDLDAQEATLVITAQYGSPERSGVRLHAALLDGAGATNELGVTTLTPHWVEYAFPVSLARDKSLLLYSEIGSPQDGRVLLDDVAIVQNYKPTTIVTNALTTLNLGAIKEYDLSSDARAGLYVRVAAMDESGETSDWSQTFFVHGDSIANWRDRCLAFDEDGQIESALKIEEIPLATEAKIDIAEEPFRFLIDDEEELTIARNKNVEKVTSVGIYACTNVFSRDWIALVPSAAERVKDVKTAEVRVVVKTGENALERLSFSGLFAQLAAKNTSKRTFLFQYRVTPTDGEMGDWIPFGAFESTFTSADVAPNLESTVKECSFETAVNAPWGAVVEARIVVEKRKDEKIAPLGFSSLVFRAQRRPAPFVIFLH